MPIRIQRKRTKGWRLPPNSICVTRGTRWGNPYAVEQYGLSLSLNLFRNTVNGFWSPGLLKEELDSVVDAAYAAHHGFLKRLGSHPLECVSELRGKNLACWCREGAACHADILLELANPAS